MAPAYLLGKEEVGERSFGARRLASYAEALKLKV
jgi:hypothetical protein